ncbi:MAG: type II toxin-antitoxin system RatA family toxin [Pseudomonadota bacterium]
MTGHIEELVVPYTPAQMLNLVSDIETYPRFIKWVKALRKSRPREEGDVHDCIGEAVVGFKGFTEQFATTVQTDRSAMTVKARLVRGPFRKLENDWHFGECENNSTRITFRIDYQFSNPILSALASANKEVAVRKIMEAFVDEAARRYSSIDEQMDGSPPILGAEHRSSDKPSTG